MYSYIRYSKKKHYLCIDNDSLEMKYRELEKMLRKIGCYDTGTEQAGHPLWYSPITGKVFSMSHHHSEEVATGTLKSIQKTAGLSK